MKDDFQDLTLIDSNSVIQAKSIIEEQANEAFKSNYASIKEQAVKVYTMWEKDGILKPDIEKAAEKIAIYAVIRVLEERGAGELYAEISKFRSQIKADGYYGHQLLETCQTKVEWVSLSSQELWQIIVRESKLLQICLDFYGQEFRGQLESPKPN